MSSYAVTDVCPAGAQTVVQSDRTVALSAFAMRRADPRTLYAQVTEDGQIIKQFARRSIDVQAMGLDV